MSSRLSQGPFALLNKPCRGTQVIYRWAEWHRTRRVSRALRVRVYRKVDLLASEERRLVVYDYGDTFGILEVGNVAPRIRAFREWSAPSRKVFGTLARHGWQLVSDGKVVEVAHGH